MNRNVIGAIFKRNFSAYFSTPTGYVFICVFVLLSSFAAFWPAEFFANNLANLDQLNRYLPFILLVFVPAITMSVWAEEKRQGTDELLLTIPAADIDVVLGKFLAAVAIYAVSLVFSLFCNFIVLSTLGNPDIGLFFGTYLGYFLVGTAMLSIGMVASFLTGNLTVAFILGALFNAPLAFLAYADNVVSPQYAYMVKRWSLAEQLQDFSRGVISLSGVAYFVMIVVAMLYLSMVLIGRRHWQGGKEGSSLGMHYLVRTVSLFIIAGSVVLVLSRFHLRADVTSERLSSLSPNTKALIRGLETKYPIHIEAFVSPSVPESYAPTRLNLLNTLREFESLNSDQIQVDVFDTERFSEAAQRAEQQYDIVGHTVVTRTRGELAQETIYMGLAFTSGLKKVVVPFVDRGTPVEYELARSIVTVAEDNRKKIGVLTTDARLFSSFNPQTFMPTPAELIIEELGKQYEVVQVRADQPITEKFDVLMAVQPSSLTPQQMQNFIAVVRSGQPTAIFEDPLPYLDQNVPGTSAPKRPPQQMPFMMNQQPQPKGDIRPLWRFLGIDFPGDRIIWQDYNPYPQYPFPPEFIFVDGGIPDAKPFNEKDEISSKIEQLLFVYTGYIVPQNASDFDVRPLVTTGNLTGARTYTEITTNSQSRAFSNPTGTEYVIAAHITGDIPDDSSTSATNPDDAENKEGEAEGEKTPKKLNVVVVADIDLFYRDFFLLRQQGQDPESDFMINLDNVTFTLNILDSLAGERRFIDIRSRRPRHRTLVAIEDRTQAARDEARLAREAAERRLREVQEEEQKKFNEELEGLKKRKDLDPRQLAIQLALAENVGQRRLDTKVQRERDRVARENERITTKLKNEIREVQDQFKLGAVIIPPIPPLLVALAVFFHRRSREKEGVARSRLRST